MIFAPAQKTATGERASSSRSADWSSGWPRWTPPMPPVAKKRMPAIAAARMVAATVVAPALPPASTRSEEHTSELQSRLHLVCRLLLEKKKKNTSHVTIYDASVIGL